MTNRPPCDTLIRAGICITQDDRRSVLEDAGIAIKQGNILAAGQWKDIVLAHNAQEFIDLSDCLVMPGLINTHTHAAMAAFRGFADDLPLMEWLTGHIWPVENTLSPEIVHAGTLIGCAEMLASGTTCFTDMYLFEPDAARAVETAGMRAVLGEGVLSFPTRAYDSPEQAFEHIEAFTKATAQSTLVSTAVAPHAVYTTTPETLKNSFELARRLDIPWTIHAAESEEETRQCLEQFGARPVQYLHDLGLLTPRTLLVHMTDVTDEEIALTACSGASVSHNPRSNMKLASGTCRTHAMLEAGVNVCLGTDGPGSNNKLNMFAEMRTCALLGKISAMNPTRLDAQQVLDMATVNAARAIGRHDLGTLVPGAAADLIALDMTHPSLAPMITPVSQVVYAATGAETKLTMVQGQTVFKSGTFSGISRSKLSSAARKLKEWTTHEASGKN